MTVMITLKCGNANQSHIYCVNDLSAIFRATHELDNSICISVE